MPSKKGEEILGLSMCLVPAQSKQQGESSGTVERVLVSEFLWLGGNYLQCRCENLLETGLLGKESQLTVQVANTGTRRQGSLMEAEWATSHG